MYFTDYLLNILFPKNCLSCGREGSYICAECFSKIPVQKSFHCLVCHKRSSDGKACPECKKRAKLSITGLLIASDWRNLLVRQLIYECKYRFINELTQPMALIIAKFLTSNYLIAWPSSPETKLANWSIEKLILIPVPLHKRRLAWRGFNQAKIICDHLTKHLNILTIDNLILRDRHTPPQMEIKDKNERIKNVSDAFIINKKIENKSLVKNRIIILIDDLATTGSTFEECAKILKPLKPKEIWGLAIARG